MQFQNIAPIGYPLLDLLGTMRGVSIDDEVGPPSLSMLEELIQKANKGLRSESTFEHLEQQSALIING